jgi:hypothetical protein
MAPIDMGDERGCSVLHDNSTLWVYRKIFQEVLIWISKFYQRSLS